MSVIALTPYDVETPATRAGALDCGALVDLTDEAARLGFKHPVAVTREVWEDCCYWDAYIEATKTGYSAEETEGRVRDLLANALFAARRSQRSSTYFTYRRIPVGGKVIRTAAVTLRVSIAPGDEREPVITIEFPED